MPDGDQMQLIDLRRLAQFMAGAGCSRRSITLTVILHAGRMTRPDNAGEKDEAVERTWHNANVKQTYPPRHPPP